MECADLNSFLHKDETGVEAEAEMSKVVEAPHKLRPFLLRRVKSDVEKNLLRVLSLLRNRLLTRGLCQILVDLSPIVGVSWEFYFVCSFLPWDLGCAHFVDFTYGLYEITAARPAPPPGA